MDLIEAGMSFLGCSEKLGTHREIIDVYNKIRPLPRGYKVWYHDPWCMIFVSACAWLTDMGKRFPYECSCPKAIDKLASEGLWTENDAFIPRRNDLIFYHWGECRSEDCIAVPAHVGIVAGVKDGFISVLEGNFNDCVQYREITLNHESIRGFGRTSELYEDDEIDLDTVAYQVIAGKWGNMPERKALLETAGYDFNSVQDLVNEIYEDKNIPGNNRIFEIAHEVIMGEWGNDPERKKALIDAGYDYKAVQDYVNYILEREKE